MEFSFLDFCSGIGAGRLGLENENGKCLAYSEINPHSIKTYNLFFKTYDKFLGDLTKIDYTEIPSADLLISGFPCQTFSINGKREAFNDDRGQIIFHISKVLKEKKIKYFILENVKGLVSSNKGEALKTILKLLSDAGYNVYYKVLNTLSFGLPQSRERIYFVGVRKDLKQHQYIFPEGDVEIPEISNYLIESGDEYIFDKYDTFNKYVNNKYNIGKFDLKELLSENNLVLDTRQSDLRLYRGYIPTLRAGRNGLLYVKNGVLRNLSGGESLLFQGFNMKHYTLSRDISSSKLLEQAGNAMSVNVISALVRNLKNIMEKIKMNKHLIELGSQTAKAGFQNEDDVVNTFNNWNKDQLAQEWLIAMNYDVEEIEYVVAEKIKGSYKADIQVRVTIKLKSLIDSQNIQVKLVSNKKGFNQIDKRWLKSYNELWGIPKDIYSTLQYFTGELAPYKKGTKDNRRMFLTEMDTLQQDCLLKFLSEKKYLIISDILKGRGKFAAEWMLVVRKTEYTDWVLKSINEVINYYSSGDIVITSQGSIKMGKITMQRKGGDNGRDTAKMLQFKIDPTELFDI